MARARGLHAQGAEFREADAYLPQSVLGTFDGGLANFWLSHVPKRRMDEFLLRFQRRLGVESVIFMADNVYIQGIGGELVSRPGCRDTFKLRELSDGSKHEVLKNCYDPDELSRILSPRVSNLQVQSGNCYWWVSYVVF